MVYTIGEDVATGRTPFMRKLVYAAAGVLLVAEALAIILPVSPLAKSTAESWVQLAVLVVAFLGAVLGAFGPRRERPLFIVVSMATGSFLVAVGIKVYFLVAHHSLTVSPSPDDLWLYVGLLAVLTVCVMFGRQVHGSGLATAGRAIDYASITVCAFSLIFATVLRPLGITGPGVSGLRTAIMIGYSSLPVSCALYPLVFRRMRLRGWAAILQTSLILAGVYAIVGLTVVGVGEYHLGSLALAGADALMSVMLFMLGASGIWWATDVHASSDVSEPPLPTPETWPAFAMLTLALIGIPMGIYATLRWNDERSALVSGGLTSVLVLLVAARTVVMRLEISRLTDREEVLQRYRDIVENAPFAVLVLNNKHEIMFANRAAANMLDTPTPADLAGLDIATFVEEPAAVDGDPGSFGYLVRIQSQSLTVPPLTLPTARVTVRTRAGRLVIAERTLALITYGGKMSILAQASDVTARVEAERIAEQYRDRLRSLATELMLAEARERRMLAETLHEHLGHLLANARTRIRAAETKGFAEGGDIDTALSMIDDAIEDTRALTAELAPQSLYREGLVAALIDFATRTTDTHHIDCAVEGHIDESCLTDELLAVIYRSTRELVMNAVKHSGSASIRLCLSHEGTRVRVSVIDDGCGFDPDAAAGGSARTFGLFSVKESIRAAGGTLDIDSAEQRGTRAHIRLPAAEGQTV